MLHGDRRATQTLNVWYIRAPQHKRSRTIVKTCIVEIPMLHPLVCARLRAGTEHSTCSPSKTFPICVRISGFVLFGTDARDARGAQPSRLLFGVQALFFLTPICHGQSRGRDATSPQLTAGHCSILGLEPEIQECKVARRFGTGCCMLGTRAKLQRREQSELHVHTPTATRNRDLP